MDTKDDCVFVKFKDLKKDIIVDAAFECMEDCLKFFSMYNINTISIISCEV